MSTQVGQVLGVNQIFHGYRNVLVGNTGGLDTPNVYKKARKRVMM